MLQEKETESEDMKDTEGETDASSEGPLKDA
jgi:hypothetical protein